MKLATIIGGSGYIGEAVIESLIKDNYQIHQLTGDATEIECYQRLAKKIDVAIYLPGTNVISPIANLEEPDWDKIMSVNLDGAYLFAKYAFNALKEAKGSFIAISSILTQHPYPDRIAYAVAKAGLETLIKGLAIEWGPHGISTHCIRLGHLAGFGPKWPKNPVVLEAVRGRTPSGKLLDKEDVASYISWLVAGGCKAVSGSVIDFDGGYSMNRWPL